MGIALERTANPILEKPGTDAPPASGAGTTVAPAEPAPATPPARPKRAADWILGWYDRHRFFYLAVLVLFYLAGFNGTWRPEPDSALYLSIGRNLAQGEGYTYNGVPHALAYPGMPYLHAVIFRLTGLSTEWPALLVMLLFSLAALALMYRLFLLHSDRPTAVVLTCMVGMNYTLFHYAFELRNEIPFLVGVLAFLAGWEAWMRARGDEPKRTGRWYDTVLLIGGLALAIVMRPHMWVLLMATIGAMFIAAIRSPQRGRLFAGMLGIAGVGVGLLMLDPRRAAHLSGTYEAALAQSIADQFTADGLRKMAVQAYGLVSGDIAEAAFGHELGPGLTLAAGLTLAILSLMLIRRRALWGLFVAGTFVMMILAPASMPRYLLPIVPLMAIAWWRAMVTINHRLPARWGNVAFAAMLAVWVAPNFLRICKTVAEQRYPPLERSYALNQTMRELADQIADKVEPDAAILAHPRQARVLAYWSDRYVNADYEMPRDRLPRYVVLPGDEDVHAYLEAQQLELGEVVTTVRHPEKQDIELTLRRVTRP